MGEPFVIEVGVDTSREHGPHPEPADPFGGAPLLPAILDTQELPQGVPAHVVLVRLVLPVRVPPPGPDPNEHAVALQLRAHRARRPLRHAGLSGEPGVAAVDHAALRREAHDGGHHLAAGARQVVVALPALALADGGEALEYLEIPHLSAMEIPRAHPRDHREATPTLPARKVEELPPLGLVVGHQVELPLVGGGLAAELELLLGRISCGYLFVQVVDRALDVEQQWFHVFATQGSATLENRPERRRMRRYEGFSGQICI